jgi:hypothetical protein
MMRTGHSKKLDNFDYFYFLVIIIYAAMAVPATKSMVRPHTDDLIAYIIPWVLTAFMAIKHRVYFTDKTLLKVLLVYVLWVVLQTVKYKIFYDGSLIFLGNILIAYMLIKIYDVRMFRMYEKIVVALSALAIVGWVLQTLIPGPFTAFMNATSIHGFTEGQTIVANNILFSLSDYSRDINAGHIIPRNSGFSWEPGRYSSMVIFALFFNIARTKFVIKRNSSFYILFLALLTAQSTTGYSAFIFIIFMIVMNKPLNLRIISIFLILIPIISGAIFLPFMGQKVSNLWSQEDSLMRFQESIDYSESIGEEIVIVPQRFDSIKLNFINIYNDPILGYGIEPENSFVKTAISPMLSPTGGVIQIFSEFGFIMGVLVYYLLYKSSIWFANYYQYKGKLHFIILFSMLSISYSFWFVPLYMSLWMFPLFNSNIISDNKISTYEKS